MLKVPILLVEVMVRNLAADIMAHVALRWYYYLVVVVVVVVVVNT